MLFTFDFNNYEKPVLAHCTKEAEKNKEWAVNKVKELGSEEWKGASEMSQQMLKKYLHTPITEMAIYNYKYLKLRSHSDHAGRPIDPQAFNLWEQLTGKKPF